jgi:hypothetical protein
MIRLLAGVMACDALAAQLTSILKVFSYHSAACECLVSPSRNECCFGGLRGGCRFLA